MQNILFNSLWREILTVTPQVNTVRYGPPSDGGYVVPDLKYDTVLTVGVADDIGFEQDVMEVHPATEFHLFDPTIEKCPEGLPNSKFYTVGLGKGDNMITMSELLTYAKGNTLLKMDCEGGEWSCDMDLADLTVVSAISVEIHHLAAIHAYEHFLKVLKNITKDFVCVNSHANNAVGMFFYNNLYVPNIMELSFIRKDLFETNRVEFPILGKNYPNNPDKPEIELF